MPVAVSTLCLSFYKCWSFFEQCVTVVCHCALSLPGLGNVGRLSYRQFITSVDLGGGDTATRSIIKHFSLGMSAILSRYCMFMILFIYSRYQCTSVLRIQIGLSNPDLFRPPPYTTHGTVSVLIKCMLHNAHNPVDNLVYLSYGYWSGPTTRWKQPE